jgi:8-oxo-dGTP pyrophosphatase MutT (NUDIX family)
MKPYLHVVECAIEYKDRFLIIEHPQTKYAAGLLSFPGGKIDLEDEKHQDDILRAGVKREIFEEVGLTLLDPIEYVFSSYFVFKAKNNMPIINSTFYCQLDRTIPEVNISPTEIANYAWMTSEEVFHADNASEWLKSYMKKIADYKLER